MAKRIPAPEFIHGLTPADLPAEVLRMARRCLADTLSVWAAGAATAPARIARNHAARRYPGRLPLPFDGRPVNPAGFAFAGAASIDALDAHDGHQSCKGHASVALVPALIAELGDRSCTLDAFLCHLIAGEEIALRAALSLHATAPDYHSSGAWNALGCAAIASRLRGLPPAQTREALGIAEYYGPRAPMMRCIDHPAMVKDSSSWGALTGISAADLAEDGFTGAPALTVEAAEVADIWSDLGRRWRILESNFKAYPVCRWAHPPVEAALSLLRAEDILPADITGITVTTFHEATRLSVRRPLDGDAAQYSLPLAVALALQHGTILPGHLLPEQYSTAETWRLADLVEFEESSDCNAAFPDERYASVSLTLRDGRRFTSEFKAARGNYDAPLSDQELAGKMELYTSGVLTSRQRGVLADLLLAPAKPQPDFNVLELFQPGQEASG
ncbi:MmgE/PrpD family protein [Leisingera sp. ANG-M1]|uniref:MmgE/PrpD family protein n=1 Tax=Leisingera sp. ANG-M1 TaxID=1577895 RepID=UPI000690650D|nr:MmgE/PrpD family protein [Leisingera sp. ANG-M1]